MRSCSSECADVRVSGVNSVLCCVWWSTLLSLMMTINSGGCGIFLGGGEVRGVEARGFVSGKQEWGGRSAGSSYCVVRGGRPPWSTSLSCYCNCAPNSSACRVSTKGTTSVPPPSIEKPALLRGTPPRRVQTSDLFRPCVLLTMSARDIRQAGERGWPTGREVLRSAEGRRSTTQNQQQKQKPPQQRHHRQPKRQQRHHRRHYYKQPKKKNTITINNSNSNSNNQLPSLPPPPPLNNNRPKTRLPLSFVSQHSPDIVPHARPRKPPHRPRPGPPFLREAPSKDRLRRGVGLGHPGRRPSLRRPRPRLDRWEHAGGGSVLGRLGGANLTVKQGGGGGGGGLLELMSIVWFTGWRCVNT